MRKDFERFTDEQLHYISFLYARHLGKTFLSVAIAEELMMRKIFKSELPKKTI